MPRSALTLIVYLQFLSVTSYAQQAAPPQQESERKAGDRMTLKIKDIEYAFRWCPPGTFMMGSPLDEVGRNKDETQHKVILSQGFWMLETPVTNGMWRSVMGNRRYPESEQFDKYPKDSLSWFDCRVYIALLNVQDVAPAGFKFSLPTEAQWEYACRAGTTTAYYFGDTLNNNQANFDNNAAGLTDVGMYPANAWGLYDMHGNVGEWCADRHGDYSIPITNRTVTDPIGGAPRDNRERDVRVVRGGNYGFEAKHCRSAFRGGGFPDVKGHGLRLVLVHHSSKS